MLVCVLVYPQDYLCVRGELTKSLLVLLRVLLLIVRDVVKLPEHKTVQASTKAHQRRLRPQLPETTTYV